MIKSGLCSLTLGKLPVEEVIDAAVTSGLQGVEWWGTGHVPHGDAKTAATVRGLTEKAGLEVSSYGSYYRCAISEGAGLTFQSVLDSARALGAPTIRVWAGNCDYQNADNAFIQKVIDDANRIADSAAVYGISITFEYHGGTLTDRNETAIKFANQLSHPNIYFSWQPPHGYSVEHALSGLSGILHRLSTIHVYHWTMGSYEKSIVNETIRPLLYPDDFFRHPLADGGDRWEAYFKAADTTGRDHFALLEFVKDDSNEQFYQDAAVLQQIISQNIG